MIHFVPKKVGRVFPMVVVSILPNSNTMTIWKTKPTLVWKLSDWTFFEYYKERNEEKRRNQTKIYSSKFFVRNTWSASLDWWNFERWGSIYGAWEWKIPSSWIIIQSEWCHDSSGKISMTLHLTPAHFGPDFINKFIFRWDCQMLFMNQYCDVIVTSSQFYIETLWQWGVMSNLKIFAHDYWREYEVWPMTNMTSVLAILKILLRQVWTINWGAW